MSATNASPARPVARRRWRLAQNVLLAVASTAFVLLSLELGAAALGLQTGFFLGATRSDCLRRDALLEWVMRPGCRGQVLSRELRTNALGLRGPELREDGSVRLLALGDSCTFGWQVDAGEAYPALLEQRLNARAAGPRFQVVNAGVPGYTSHQGLAYLRERGVRLAPALVVIGFGFNDIATNIGDDETRIGRARRVLPLLRLDDGLRARSRLYRWIRWRLQPMAPTIAGVRVADEKYGANLREMIRLARAHGARPLLLDFFLRPRPDLPVAGHPTTLARVATELGVPLVFYDGPRFDIVHPTQDGYRHLTDQIMAALDQAGYLDDLAAARAPDIRR